MSQVLSAVPKAERDLRSVELEVRSLQHDFGKVLRQSAGPVPGAGAHPRSPRAEGTSIFDAASANDGTASLECKTGEGSGEPGSPRQQQHQQLQQKQQEEALVAQQGSYIEDLEALDFVKRNMEDTKALLHEAAAWERLVREVEVVADGGDLSRIADHVALLQSSAAALADMPDSDRRAEVLAGVNARFDALVLPQLNDALARDDGEALRGLVDVFGRLGRLQFLVKTFASSRVRPLMECWAEACDSAAPPAEAIGA